MPARIENCPIIETVIEIRFESTVIKEAVFGLIYQQIKGGFPNPPQALPILQLPEPLRKVDPNLQFKPHYRLENSHFIVQIGPDVLTISPIMPYNGWAYLKPYASQIISQIVSAGIISKVTRLGLRYVNLFETVIINQLNLSLTVNQADILMNNIHIKTELKSGDFTNILQVVTMAESKHPLFGVRRGTLVDIDTCREYNDNTFTANHNNELETAHNSEINLFYSLLNENLLNSLRPIYNG